MNIDSYKVQNAVSYVLGALIGGFVAGKIAEYVLNKLDQPEVVEETIPSPEPEETPSEELPEEPKKEEKPEVSKKKKQEALVTDYTKFRQIVPNQHVQKARLKELASQYQAEEEPAPYDPTKPYIISLEEYCEANGREKRLLKYYEDDDTLVGDDEQPIPEMEELLGPDALVKFGTRSDDPEVVYVRNNRLGVDFEVVRSHGSYQFNVMGMSDDEQQPEKKSKKRKRKSVGDEERTDD